MLKGVKIIHSQISDSNLSYFYGSQKEVENNRRRFLAKYNLTLEQCVAARLTHSTKIAVVEHGGQGRGMRDFDSGVEGDAMITTKNIPLLLLTADCLPVVIFDPDHQTLALAHVNTNNTVKNYLQKIVEQLIQEFGSQPSKLLVYLGPSIRRESYIKDKKDFTPDMIDFLLPFATLVSESRIAIDLVSYNLSQLERVGVLKNNIEISPVGTYTSLLYFSHRRSQDLGEPEGRFGTLVIPNNYKI